MMLALTPALRINDVQNLPNGAQPMLTGVTSRQAGPTPMGTTAEDIVSQAEESTGREVSSGGTPRYTRRLSDKILIAFHHACDQSDFEVAEQLLHILEMMLTRRPLTPDGTRRRNMESLVAAHERLWHLRHPHIGDDF
jgi:hypothetical protein